MPRHLIPEPFRQFAVPGHLCYVARALAVRVGGFELHEPVPTFAKEEFSDPAMPTVRYLV